jgi:hypothetical protein
MGAGRCLLLLWVAGADCHDAFAAAWQHLRIRDLDASCWVQPNI